MAILATGNTFADGDQVTSTKLNNIANAATFAADSVDDSTTALSGGKIIIKDGGVTPAKLSTNHPNWDATGLGVGTSSPSSKLDVETSSSSADGIDINNTSTGDPVLEFQLAGTSKFTMGVDNSDSDKFKIGTTAVETSTCLTIDSTGPKITIGSGAAADTAIIFDGNAQDYYIALDDSADDLLIGLGSTIGTTPAISIDENLKSTFGGDVVIGGTTPTLTIGDAGAEDTAIVFDGNAQDFYLGLDDSADDLIIGVGSTVGTTPAISITDGRAVTLNTSLTLASGATVTALLDEDNMASDSATSLATQQSIKAYVDAQVDTADSLSEILAIGNTSGGTNIVLSTTDQVQFGDIGTYIHQSADGVLDLVSDTEIEINATTIDINGTLRIDGATTGGTDIEISGELSAATLDISGNADIDGTTNLDIVDIDGAVDMATTLTLAGNADFNGNLDVDGITNLDVVDIDGNVQLDGTLTVGVNDTGYDVKLFGATSGAYLLWDESADKLLTAGGTVIDIVKDKLLIGSTAVTTTAAELNVLDGVTAGTVSASLAVVVDGSKNIATLGTVGCGAITSTGSSSFGATSFGDADITNVGNIALDSISSDAGTNITVTLGTDAADDFIVGNNSALVVEGDNDRVGIGTAAPAEKLEVVGNIIMDASNANLKIKSGAGGTTGAINWTFNSDTTVYSNIDFAYDTRATQGLRIQSANSYPITMDSGEDIMFSTSGTTRMTVTESSGEVNVVGELSAASLDISGDIDVDGTTNLDVVDIDGAVDMASTLTVTGGITSTAALNTFGGTAFNGQNVTGIQDIALSAGTASATAVTIGNPISSLCPQLTMTRQGGSTTGNDFIKLETSAGEVFAVNANGGIDCGGITVGVDDTGHDVKFFGATSGSYMMWDESVNTLSTVAGVIDCASAFGVPKVRLKALSSRGSIDLYNEDANSSGQWKFDNYGSVFILYNTDDGSEEVRVQLGTDSSDDGYVSVYSAAGAETINISGDGSASFSGAVSKGSGSFNIEHPLESKKDTHRLVHSFIEGPQADLIYRGKVDLVDGSATVNIDTTSGMTDGTFVVLCRDIQSFTTNESGWTAVRSSVSGNILTIEAQDATCTDSISWMVVGERQDDHMMDTGWTDENGKAIVEPLIPEPEEEEEEIEPEEEVLPEEEEVEEAEVEPEDDE